MLAGKSPKAPSGIFLGQGGSPMPPAKIRGLVFAPFLRENSSRHCESHALARESP